LVLHAKAHERALGYLALVVCHPSSTRQARDEGRDLIAKLEVDMPERIATRAKERGKTRTLKGIADEILGSL
jgi:hypothetical protein